MRCVALCCGLSLYGCEERAVSQIGELDAGSSSPSPLRDAGAGCRLFVADTLVDHACFHASMGPFRELRAGERDRAALDRPHTAFRVQLQERRGELFVGTLRFSVERPGAFAFFTERVEALSLEDEAQHVQTPFSEHATEICAALPRVVAYELQRGLYMLRLHSRQPDVLVTPERMDEGALEDNQRAECGPPPSSARDAGPSSSVDASVADAALPANDGAVHSCLLDPVLEHACLHVQHGAFVNVRASSEHTLAPALDRPHTAFRVELPTGSPAFVSYQPSRAGEHVIYLGDDRQLELSLDGAMVPAQATEAVADCEGTTRAHVYNLEAQRRYQLRLRAQPTPNPLLVIEPVSTITPSWHTRLQPCP